MNIVVKVSCDSFDDWKKEFDGHDARANVCELKQFQHYDVNKRRKSV